MGPVLLLSPWRRKSSSVCRQPATDYLAAVVVSSDSDRWRQIQDPGLVCFFMSCVCPESVGGSRHSLDWTRDQVPAARRGRLLIVLRILTDMDLGGVSSWSIVTFFCWQSAVVWDCQGGFACPNPHPIHPRQHPVRQQGHGRSQKSGNAPKRQWRGALIVFRANSPKFPKFRGWSDPPARRFQGSSLTLPALLQLSSPNPRLSAPAPHSTVHTAPPARMVRPLQRSRSRSLSRAPALASQNALLGSSSATLPGPAWSVMTMFSAASGRRAWCGSVAVSRTRSPALRGWAWRAATAVACSPEVLALIVTKPPGALAMLLFVVAGWSEGNFAPCAPRLVSKPLGTGEGWQHGRTAGSCYGKPPASHGLRPPSTGCPSRSPDLSADGGSIYCTASTISAPARLSLVGTGRAGKKARHPPLQIKLRPPAPKWARRQGAL